VTQTNKLQPKSKMAARVGNEGKYHVVIMSIHINNYGSFYSSEHDMNECIE
jgi:hypothetical protein